MLAFVWIFAIQTVVFSLVPLRFLDGEKIMKWSRLGWASLYLVGMFVFVETLVHPSAKYGGSSNASFLSMLIIFLTFTGLAVAFWAWFRFERWKDHHDSAVPDQPASAAR
jgi:protein-S-isoprenylcysteine O-methyltransferase Ste14